MCNPNSMIKNVHGTAVCSALRRITTALATCQSCLAFPPASQRPFLQRL